eukprot:CAMPEP_0172492954 /NCGR_PEP_ID=MMETSP1066-20121228/24251_1 /TAXON_ID=671091 /ORGANISM="Coscinodiscus wailesii, Strain CCMP2513" /LENGTH=227 /DNA_ID=CAMNT_0013262857 /DNA_START=75 /DNA_END=758 /DNA_ORIENTATION=-
MKAGLLSIIISILLAFATSTSTSHNLLCEKRTRILENGERSNKAKRSESPKEIVDNKNGCEDPLAAIMQTLQCIADGDGTCAGMGYAAGFQKIHNGIDTNLDFGDNPSAFWTFVLQMFVLSFSYDHRVNVGPNMASIRYIEGVQFNDGTSFGLPASDFYPFNSSYVQHEHALVTVDNDCKMTKWDQYGDNTEQNEVDDASAAFIGGLCDANVFPPEVCTVLLGGRRV